MKLRRLLFSLVFALPFICTAEGMIVLLQGYKTVQKAGGATGVAHREELVEDGKPVNVEIEHAKLSETIKNLIEYDPKIEEPVGMFKIETIPLHSLNKQQIELVFSYIKKIFDIAKTKKALVVLNINETRKEEGKKTIPQELAEHLKKDNLPIPQLTDLLWTANYLEVDILLPAIVEFLKDFLVLPENLKKFINKDSDFLALIDAIEKIDLKYQKELTKYFSLKHADKFVKTLIGHANRVRSVAFNHDGTLLASGSFNGVIKLWNPNTGNLIKTLNIGSVIAFNHDGSLLASGEDTIKLLNPRTSELIRTLPGHAHSVNSVAFSHDGSLLASGSGDKTIKIWNPTDGSLIKTINHGNFVYSVTFNHDDSLIASGSFILPPVSMNAIKLWDPNTGNIIKTLNGHNESVNSIVFNHDGTLLASGSMDKTIKIWDPNTGNLIHTLSDHNGDVNSVAFNHNGTLLASASSDNTIKLWNPITGDLIKTLSDHTDGVTSVAFNHDGSLLASGSMDKTIKLWNLNKSLFEILEQLSAQTLLERARDVAAGLRKYLGY